MADHELEFEETAQLEEKIGDGPTPMTLTFALVAAEVLRQDDAHPAGYPASRDGVRLGIAAAEDELDEVREEWRRAYRQVRGGVEQSAAYANVHDELIQLAAVCVRIARELDHA